MTGMLDGGRGRDEPCPPFADAVLDGISADADSGVEAFEQVRDEDLTSHWGLFGPGTVTWRIHSDPLFGLATLRSLALRVLHPEGLSAVFATARRVDDPWDRLTATMRLLGVATFGSGAEVAVASARMRSILMQVTGVTQNGDSYRGDDPELLLWLHCCQVASFVEVTRRGGLDLTDADHEAYVREQQRMAVVWGLDPGDVPGTRRDLTRYFRTARPQLRVTAPGRAFIGAIVAPGMPDLMALPQRNRPAWAPVAGLAFSSLPPWARRLYSSPPRSGPASLSQSATTVALHSLRDSLSGRSGQAGAGLA